MGKFYWVFDLDRCIGCESCVVACKQEHSTPPGIQYRRVHSVNPELYPGFPTYRISLACNHCEDPACFKGCPARAYGLKDGIVFHDQTLCIGCKYCIWLCPYDAPQFSEARGKVEKCTLCIERLKRGLDPACVSACPTQALRLAKNIPNEDQEELMATLPGFPKDKTRSKLRIKGKRRISKERGKR